MPARPGSGRTVDEPKDGTASGDLTSRFPFNQPDSWLAGMNAPTTTPKGSLVSLTGYERNE